MKYKILNKNLFKKNFKFFLYYYYKCIINILKITLNNKDVGFPSVFTSPILLRIELGRKKNITVAKKPHIIAINIKFPPSFSINEKFDPVLMQSVSVHSVCELLNLIY